jgi:hypothetical protein
MILDGVSRDGSGIGKLQVYVSLAGHSTVSQN